MRRVHGLLVAAATVALLAGCGGSSSSSSGKPLSVSAWKQKVDGICASVTKQSQALKKPTTPADLQPYLKKLQNIGNSEIAQLKAVNPPSQFAAGQKAVIGDLSTIWSKLGSVIDQNLTGSKLLQAAQEFGTQVQAPAKDYLARTKAAGLTSCILTTTG